MSLVLYHGFDNNLTFPEAADINGMEVGYHKVT